MIAHQALVYGSDAEFLAVTVPFCREGLAAGDAVLAVTGEANIALLRAELGDAVAYVPAFEWYRTPGRTLAAYHQYVNDQKGSHPVVRVIGEPVWHGRDEVETAEWTRYEAVLNVAFADSPARIVCPYDTRTLPERVVVDARRTHPELAHGPSPDFAEPIDGWCRPLEDLAGDVRRMPLVADLTAVRGFVAAAAEEFGLRGEAVDRLVFAVNEVATNALLHGGGVGEVTVGRSPHRVVCDVTDDGGGALPWHAGYLPPGDGRRAGLWTVRQLADLVEIHAGPGRTTVRLHLA